MRAWLDWSFVLSAAAVCRQIIIDARMVVRKAVSWTRDKLIPLPGLTTTQWRSSKISLPFPSRIFHVPSLQIPCHDARHVRWLTCTVQLHLVICQQDTNGGSTTTGGVIHGFCSILSTAESTAGTAVPPRSWCLYVLLCQIRSKQTLAVINILQSTMTHVSDGGLDGTTEDSR